MLQGRTVAGRKMNVHVRGVSANHPPTIHQPSTNHPPTIHQPSTNHPPTIHQPSTNHPPTIGVVVNSFFLPIFKQLLALLFISMMTSVVFAVHAFVCACVCVCFVVVRAGYVIIAVRVARAVRMGQGEG